MDFSALFIIASELIYLWNYQVEFAEDRNKWPDHYDGSAPIFLAAIRTAKCMADSLCVSVTI